MRGICWLGCAFATAAACSHPSPPPRTVDNAAPEHVTAASPTLAQRATLVVVGRLISYPDAPQAAVDIDVELKGSAGYGVIIDSKLGVTHGDEGIFYLVPSPTAPDRWTLLAAKAEPKSRQDAVIAELSRVEATPVPAALVGDLAAFRSAPTMADRNPGIRAAVKILESWSPIGSSPRDVRAALGEPSTVEGTRWHYMRHNGESGAIFWIDFANDRAVAVHIGRTQ